MPTHHRRLPDDLKQLFDIIQQGHLFALQDWLKANRPIRVSEGPGKNLALLDEAIDPDGSRRSPPAYESRQTGNPCGLLTFSIKEPRHYSSEEIQKWSETNKLPLQELLAQLVGAVRKYFLDAQERRAHQKIQWEKDRIESERHWREYQKQEAIRLQKEKEQKHAEAIAVARNARKRSDQFGRGVGKL